jgi:23S rRNA (uracil1939-C5)-methyltransferase
VPHPTLTVGQTLRLRVDHLSSDGDGVARQDGCVVFVPYTAPGDDIEAVIEDAQPRFVRARLQTLIAPGSGRVKPPCPYHFDIAAPQRLYCGGCSWQHLAYERQLQAKERLVRDALERVGGFKGLTVEPVIGMDEPWRYRNKIQQPVGWSPKRRVITGFYAPSSHEIVPIDDCLVQPELSVRIIRRIVQLAEEFRWIPYDETKHAGWLRHILVRCTLPDDEAPEGRALVVFVTKSEDFPRENQMVERLANEFMPALVGIHHNVNPGRTNVILGRDWRCIAGSETIEERLGTLRFRLSPRSFFQINTLQAEKLYDVVRERAGRGGALWDLYSGVGSIGLYLADHFREVLGVEEVESAVLDATDNAQLNRIKHARFITAPVERFLRRPGGTHGDSLTILIDPPRAGCKPEVLSAILGRAPKQILYVSCDAGTLARDAAILSKGRYRIDHVQPVDLFPHTPHIETVVHFVRKTAQ